MPKYVIVYRDTDPRAECPAACWTTRVGSTDNYPTDKADATLFPDRVSARCLMRALGLDDGDHTVEEVV